MEPFVIGEMTVYGLQERVVGKAQGAGRLYVPKDWIGKRVRVLLMESCDP